MADCFSLENTDELLERLNNRARNCATDKALIYYDYDAIDIIEQLIVENAKLKAERDAAVRDMTEFYKCKICKHYDKNSPNYGYTEDCENCGAYPWEDNEAPSKWEWRGVQND